ncbi:MAG: phosphoribosyltransferase [Flavipsychrobacter sp.]|nr:phosphoribosyltransferase [Flavipsychrobacter sp.]
MNKKKRVLILDKERISYKLRRMAYEIWERNSEEKEIVLLGIEEGGKILADNLCTILKEISPLKIVSISLAMNKKKPLNHVINIEENLSGRSVILVDDVVNSGKTIMYSLNAILSYDLKKLAVAVLVDRKHKSFPIASDIIGHSVATTLQEHIEVETKGNEIIAVYLE